VTSATQHENPLLRRRAPTQQRSKLRVQSILEAASEVIVESGVNAATMRAIAERADMSVASLYQYFSDRDDIVMDLVRRDTADMDERVAVGLAGLDVISVRSVVNATMRAFVDSYHHRPSFVMIWWRGRTNHAVVEYCAAHNIRVATALHAFGLGAGLLRPDTELVDVEIAVEVGDRLFEMAFKDDLRGNETLLDKGINLVVGYLETFATEAGTKGLTKEALGG